MSNQIKKDQIIAEILKDGADPNAIARNIIEAQNTFDTYRQEVLEKLRNAGIAPNSPLYLKRLAILADTEGTLNEAIQEVRAIHLRGRQLPFYGLILRKANSLQRRYDIKKFIDRRFLFRLAIITTLVAVIISGLVFLLWRYERRTHEINTIFETYFDSKFCQCGSNSSGSPRYFTKSPFQRVYIEFQGEKQLQWSDSFDIVRRKRLTIKRWFEKTRACSISSGKCLEYFTSQQGYPDYVSLEFISNGIKDTSLSATDKFFDQCVKPTCDEIQANSIGKEVLNTSLLVGYGKLYEFMSNKDKAKEDASIAAQKSIIERFFTRCDNCALDSKESTIPSKLSYFTKTCDSYYGRDDEKCNVWDVEEYVNLYISDVFINEYRSYKRNIDDNTEWTGEIRLKTEAVRRFRLVNAPTSLYSSKRSYYLPSEYGAFALDIIKKKGESWEFYVEGKNWEGRRYFYDSLRLPVSRSEISRCLALPLSDEPDKPYGVNWKHSR